MPVLNYIAHYQPYSGYPVDNSYHSFLRISWDCYGRPLSTLLWLSSIQLLSFIPMNILGLLWTSTDSYSIIAGPLLCICCDSCVSQEHPKTTVTVSPPAVAICPLVHASIWGFSCVPGTSWDYCVTTCYSNMPSCPSIRGFPCIPGTP